MSKDKKKRVDFDVDIYCKEAIRICNDFVDYKFDYSAESLSVMEEIIQHIRKMVREGKQNKEDLWAIACFFGTYVGETFLRIGLKKLGFKWGTNDQKMPVLINNENNIISPLTKIHKKLIDEKEGKDIEGSIIDFYNGFMMVLEHHYGSKNCKDAVDDSGTWDYFEINDISDFDRAFDKIAENGKSSIKKKSGKRGKNDKKSKN